MGTSLSPSDRSEVAEVAGGYLDRLVVLLDDPRLSLTDRAAVWGTLHRISLALQRALRGPIREELIDHMRTTSTRAMGSVHLRTTGVGVTYVCNDPGNWDDAGIQADLETLRANPRTSPYVRSVPAHLEIDQVALGSDVASGLADAHALYRELRAKGWRTETGRRFSLETRP